MSDGNSPSTLSYLRQYRFQRKPNIPGSSGSVTVQSSPSGSRECILQITRATVLEMGHVLSNCYHEEFDWGLYYNCQGLVFCAGYAENHVSLNCVVALAYFNDTDVGWWI